MAVPFAATGKRFVSPLPQARITAGIAPAANTIPNSGILPRDFLNEDKNNAHL